MFSSPSGWPGGLLDRIQALIASGRVAIAQRDEDERPPGRSAKLRAGTRLRGGDAVTVRLDSAFVDARARGEAGVRPRSTSRSSTRTISWLR